MQTRQFSRYFKGRNLRALSFACRKKKTKKNAKYLTKTFALDDFWKKFFFSEWAKSKEKNSSSL